MRYRISANLLVGLALTGCGSSNSHMQELDPNAIVRAPAGVPADTDVKLYEINGVSGLVAHGDTLVVMVYGKGSREAGLRVENARAGFSSLNRWLKTAQINAKSDLLRVPDLDDQSGSRFYYFSRTGNRWGFRAICTGAWDNDPKYPPTCDATYDASLKIVSVLTPEPIFVSNGSAIAKIALKTLADNGAI